MKKQLSKTAPKPKTKKTKTAATPAEQFAKLWKQVQKEKASIAEALRQQAALVAQFNAEVLADEIALSSQLYRETQHLLGYFGKKSLSFHQRQILLVWIHDNITGLSIRPFKCEFDLQLIISELQGYVIEFLGGDAELDLEAESNAGDREFEFDEFEAQSTDSRLHDEEWEDEEQPWEVKEKADTQAAEALFNASSVNKMFRQLAKIFHPDLEQDEEQKAIKHEQMANLLKARASQDVFTIFELFCSQGGKGLPSFDDQELTRLNQLLKQQVRKVQQEKEQALFDNPLHGMIYQRFYRKNPQFTFLALKNHKQDILRDIQQSKTLIATTSSLKALKQVLKAREAALEMEFLAELDWG